MTSKFHLHLSFLYLSLRLKNPTLSREHRTTLKLLIAIIHILELGFYKVEMSSEVVTLKTKESLLQPGLWCTDDYVQPFIWTCLPLSQYYKGGIKFIHPARQFNYCNIESTNIVCPVVFVSLCLAAQRVTKLRSPLLSKWGAWLLRNHLPFRETFILILKLVVIIVIILLVVFFRRLRVYIDCRLVLLCGLNGASVLSIIFVSC